MRFLLLAVLLTGCGMIPEDEEKKLAQKGEVYAICHQFWPGEPLGNRTRITASDCASLQTALNARCRVVNSGFNEIEGTNCPHVYAP